MHACISSGARNTLTSAGPSWPSAPRRKLGPLWLREQISKGCSKVFPATTCSYLPGWSDPVACVGSLGVLSPFVLVPPLSARQQQRWFHTLGACRCPGSRDLGRTRTGGKKCGTRSPFDQLVGRRKHGKVGEGGKQK